MEVLSEWKDLAQFLSEFSKCKKPIPIRTLQRWNEHYLQLPLSKSFPSQQGRILIEKQIAIKWYQALIKLYPNLSR